MILPGRPPQQKAFPTIMLANVQSLLPKIDELDLILSIKRPNVFCITETWLTEDIDTNIIQPECYCVCRNDRTRRRGGGTAIFVRNDETYRHLQMTLGTGIENEFEVTMVELFRHQMFLFCLYIPPSLNVSLLLDIQDWLVSEVDRLLSEKSFHHVILVGDFNRFDVNQLCTELDLFDLIVNPTRKNNVLDHILISRGLSPVYCRDNVEYMSPIGRADHMTLCTRPSTSYDGSTHLADRRTRCVYDFRHSNLCKLHEEIVNVSWNEILKDEDNVSHQSHVFHQKLTDAIKLTIPTKMVPVSPYDKEWMTPTTKMLIHERWHAYRTKNWDEYNYLKNKVKAEIAKAKQLWADRMRETPLGLWRLVKLNRCGRQTDGFDQMIEEFGNAKNVLEELVSSFTATLTPDEVCSEEESDVFQKRITDDGWSFVIEEEEVFRYLSKLKARKSSGDNLVPNRVYSTLADCLARPLASIFNSCIKQRQFPDLWKQGIIIPVPKTKPAVLSKLRQIALLCPVSKIFEKLIMKNAREAIDKSYCSSQHGFRKGASTTTALIGLIHHVLQSSDDKLVSCVAIVSFDFTQAFDKVSHSLLLQRLTDCNLPCGLIMLLNSYLCNRFSRVRLRGIISKRFPVMCGVPQGSVLGPPLFCIFTSDYQPKHTLTKVIKYADDLSLVIPFANGDPTLQHQGEHRETAGLALLPTLHDVMSLSLIHI